MADGTPPIGPRVIWAPLQGSQELAMSCPCSHILYEGTRGAGKTEVQFMKFRRYVGLGYGAFWRGVIFDREYKNLDDIISKSKRYFENFGDGAKFLSGTSQLKWVWPTGEELLFRAVKDVRDYWNYHGQEFPFIGWNELTKYPNSDLYDMLMSCNRSSFLPGENPIYPDEHDPGYSMGNSERRTAAPMFLPEMPLIVFSTTNPFGAGHAWVKRRFVDTAAPGHVVRHRTNVFNPRTQQREDIVKTQVRIFGSYKENRYLSPMYIAELENMRNVNRRKAWLWGDWNIVSGGAIDDLWDVEIHACPRFKIPAGWRVDRALDWGSAKPFSVGWYAEANGEEAMIPLPGGTFALWSPPAGTLFRIYELYGTEEIGTNKGLMLSPKKVAQKVKAIDAMLLKDGWIGTAVKPGPADTSIKVSPDSDTPSIAKRMEDEGVCWTDADKSGGSRKNGLELLRDRLQNSIDAEGDGFYIMRNCEAALALLPGIPRDEVDVEDVDTDSEDHIYDEVRYRVLAVKRRATRQTF